MCSCGNSKVVSAGLRASEVVAPPPPDNSDGLATEIVTFTSPLMGFFTVDSGNRYKSYGPGSRVTIISLDKPSLLAMGLISP